MRVECRHCGALNDADPPTGGSETVVCQACGRPFTVYHEDATLNVSNIDSRALLAPVEEALAAAEEGSWDDEGGENTLAMHMESLNIPRASAMEADDDAGQRTALMDPRVSGQVMEVDTGGDDFDDSLARIAIGGEQWRIQNDRGAIYELDSMEAAANWLEGRSNLSSYAISRGNGPFLSPEQHPDLLARLGLQPGDVALGAGLNLEPPPAAEHSSIPRRSSADLLLRSQGDGDGGTLGLGFVLWITLIGVGITVSSTVLGARLGWMTSLSLAPPPAISAAELASKSDRITRAVAAYDAEKYNAAAQLLEELAAEPGAPAEIHRYLAAALHRTGRQVEAKQALSRYRALRDVQRKQPSSKGQ